MFTRTLLAAIVIVGTFDAGVVSAQTSMRGPATGPGQSRATNRLPQASSGGRPTGLPAAGAKTDREHEAEASAKRATRICKGC